MNPLLRRVVWILWFSALAFGQPRVEEYAVVLEEPPLAARVLSRAELRSAAAAGQRAAIGAAQQALGKEIARRKVRITGSAMTLVNAIFVRATLEQAQQLAGLDGVQRVEYLPPLKRHMNRAVDLVRASQAWSVVGGVENAGAGIRIGIIDTGIDQNHPAFQDASLPMPAGFPKGRREDLPFTTNKVIAARSYVAQLPFPDIRADDSRPDDNTPRDRVGHGTAAAMIAAGRRVSGPAAAIQGIAPKAYLGNYKVFGSPGVNDSTKAPVLIQALQDALDDGMDVVTLSVGRPAFYGALDRCQNRQGGLEACDIRAEAVENAVKAGMAVVVSAGNDGDIGDQFPSYNTIHTPGTAPSAITVGASTNSHIFFAGVTVTGNNVPANLRRVNALFGNGPKPDPVTEGPLRDVAQLQDDGKACSALGNNTLAGAIALVQRGNCAFSDKVRNAEKAGAIGVVIYQSDGINSVFAPSSLAETAIPAALIGFDAGTALKSFLRANPDRVVTLDPSLAERDASYDTVAFFSSHGPAIGDVSKGEAPLKPELVAVGTDVYTAVQSLDPNGDLYDPKGFTSVQGTSFSVPMAAAAVAMVKQRNPRFTPGQLKSAVVNTAADEVDTDDGRSRAPVIGVGAGKLNTLAAVQTSATVEPATLSFGVIGTSSLPKSLTLRITNTGSAAVTLSLAASGTSDSRARLTLTPASLPLSAGQSASVAVRLEGAQPSPGRYEGAVTVRGGPVSLRVPYLYLVGDGVVFNLISLAGDNFLGVAGEQDWLMAFKAIDRYGVPVRDAAVRFRVMSGGGRINVADDATDVYGIAAARVDLGPRLGEQQFRAETGGLTLDFFGRARLAPVVGSNGVVSAASQQGGGQAAGSYISINGRGLSESTRQFSTASLPLSLSGVSVSFDDAPTSRLSLPGRLTYVSESLINVQIPWEFQGLNSALMKVSIGPGANDSSAIYRVPLSTYAPAFFEYYEPGGRQLLAGLDLSYQVLTLTNRAKRGAAIQLFANGLGPVDNTPPSGEPTPADPLPNTRAEATVTIGDRPAQVLFSGLAPYNVGVYQVNVVVAPDTPVGLQPVVLTIGGVRSKAASIAVE